MVALYTCAVLARPWGHPMNQEFRDLTEQIETDLRTNPPRGLHEVRDVPSDAPLPAYAQAVRHSAVPTLSLWADLDSAFRFSYRNRRHRSALGKRRVWFARPDHPIYVLWHAPDAELIHPGEGARRLECLVREGPTPMAFDFLHPFDATGEPYPVERLRRDAPEDVLGRTFPVAFEGPARAVGEDRQHTDPGDPDRAP